MKNIIILLALIITVCSNSFAQQTFNSLRVKDLELPSETALKILYLDGSNKVKSSSASSTVLTYVETLTSDAQTQIDAKEDAITSGLTTEWWRGDKTFQALTKSDVGLSNVDNTSDLDKPVSTATQTAITTESGLTVHKAGTETITGDKLFTGQLTATSTTKGNRPCPVMTDAEMLAIGTPANGDCVFNSTKKSQYVYDSVTPKWKANGGGGGGGTRYELMTDSSFEDSATTDGACTTCVASQESTVLVVTPTNEKALKMAFSASTGNYTVDEAVTSYMLGADATVSAWIVAPATATDCYFVSRRDGADTGDSTLLIKDGYPHYYEKIVIVGATSIGWKINCPTSITANIIADESSVKLDKRIVQLAYVQNVSDWADCDFSTLAWQGLGTVTSEDLKCKRDAGDLIISGKVVTGTVAASEIQILLPTWGGVQLVTASSSKISSPHGGGRIIRGASGSSANDMITLPIAGLSYFKVSITGTTTSPITAQNGSALFGTGENIVFDNVRIPINGWSAANPNYLTAPETFSTDYTPLIHKTTAIVAADPVGTYNTYSYGASSNTKTICASAPTQTTAHMAQHGIQLFSRLYTAASTCASPAAIYLKIGTGQKGVKLDLYKSTGKTTVGDIGYVGGASAADVNGVRLKGYEESTGIYAIDPGIQGGSVNSTANFLFSDATGQTNGYFVLNASKNPALTGMNATPHPVATIRDVKTAGTSGGGFTSGAWYQRTLNTLNDPYGIVTSLSSNRFVLPAGKYFIIGSAPAALTGQHKVKLVQDPAGTPSDVIIGTSEYSGTTANSASRSHFSGIVTITAPTTFDLQHRCSTTNGGDGFGVTAGYSISDVYSDISITKLSP